MSLLRGSRQLPSELVTYMGSTLKCFHSKQLQCNYFLRMVHRPQHQYRLVIITKKKKKLEFLRVAPKYAFVTKSPDNSAFLRSITVRDKQRHSPSLGLDSDSLVYIMPRNLSTNMPLTHH